MVVLPNVVRANYDAQYRILITSNAGTEANVDVLPWLSGPVSEPLQDIAYFQKCFIDDGTATRSRPLSGPLGAAIGRVGGRLEWQAYGACATNGAW